jgi:hypothetical protein
MEVHGRCDVPNAGWAGVAGVRFAAVNALDTHFRDIDLAAVAFRSVSAGNVKTGNAIWTGMADDGIKVGDPFEAYEAARVAGDR